MVEYSQVPPPLGPPEKPVHVCMVQVCLFFSNLLQVFLGLFEFEVYITDNVGLKKVYCAKVLYQTITTKHKV